MQTHEFTYTILLIPPSWKERHSGSSSNSSNGSNKHSNSGNNNSKTNNVVFYKCQIKTETVMKNQQMS
eukprot:6493274-Ditylum_brightwellii.AAC.1